MAESLVEKIPADLESLIPNFIENTHCEIAELEKALKAGDFLTAERLGHNIKGSALNYGFKVLAGIGRNIEIFAGLKKDEQVERELEKLKLYVEQVKIEFV